MNNEVLFEIKYVLNLDGFIFNENWPLKKYKCEVNINNNCKFETVHKPNLMDHCCSTSSML